MGWVDFVVINATVVMEIWYWYGENVYFLFGLKESFLLSEILLQRFPDRDRAKLELWEILLQQVRFYDKLLST